MLKGKSRKGSRRILTCQKKKEGWAGWLLFIFCLRIKSGCSVVSTCEQYCFKPKVRNILVFDKTDGQWLHN